MGRVYKFHEWADCSCSEVVCVRCGARWISVRPTHAKLKDILCPICGPGRVIETGERNFDKASIPEGFE